MSSLNPASPLGPRRSTPPPPPPRGGSGALGVLFTLSFLLNIVLMLGVGCFLLLVLMVGGSTSEANLPLPEKYYSGDSEAEQKIAIIEIEGVLMEGALNFAHRQIQTAADDADVKAVVVRINSPGGSITASDDLHQRLVELRDGSTAKGTVSKKALVVSMASVAASGGYYIAMPGSPVLAERTTITGSIGIYAALPNVHELAEKYGVKLVMIKRGDVKGSGSLFKKMTDQERQVWDDMVGHGYEQFIGVVEEGRPKLKGKLLEAVVKKQLPSLNDDGEPRKDENGKPIMFEYIRYLADGGIYTADKALEYGLIDKIGYLDEAVEEAKKKAGLVGNVKVVTYKEPFSLSDFLSVKAPQAKTPLDATLLSSAATPRLWYLAPGNELAGYLAAAGQ